MRALSEDANKAQFFVYVNESLPNLSWNCKDFFLIKIYLHNG